MTKQQIDQMISELVKRIDGYKSREKNLTKQERYNWVLCRTAVIKTGFYNGQIDQLEPALYNFVGKQLLNALKLNDTIIP